MGFKRGTSEAASVTEDGEARGTRIEEDQRRLLSPKIRPLSPKKKASITREVGLCISRGGEVASGPKLLDSTLDGVEIEGKKKGRLPPKRRVRDISVYSQRDRKREKRSGGACVAFDSSEQSDRSCLYAASMTIPLGRARSYSVVLGFPRATGERHQPQQSSEPIPLGARTANTGLFPHPSRKAHFLPKSSSKPSATAPNLLQIELRNQIKDSGNKNKEKPKKREAMVMQKTKQQERLFSLSLEKERQERERPIMCSGGEAKRTVEQEGRDQCRLPWQPRHLHPSWTILLSPALCTGTNWDDESSRVPPAIAGRESYCVSVRN
ncbi:hypothetical protein WN55_04849 [Dufourea novaeangliae]|uniref:Uncharacterized protein n=1 Tax=Dufourea novaeangliae TaxID=178035 RepID=A0A154PM69_DUFNO|nr:hypothetical protein WN55_04849 [Dufourea novaeangliae]